MSDKEKRQQEAQMKLALGEISKADFDSLFSQLEIPEEGSCALEKSENPAHNIAKEENLPEFSMSELENEPNIEEQTTPSEARKDKDPPEQEPVLAYREIGQYKILKLLGRGGMGSVYLAVHKNARFARARGKVAIKLIKPVYADFPELRKRFEQEAALGTTINHPNIASVIDLIEEENILAFVMEFVEGEELRKKISDAGMSLEEVLSYITPIAEALDYLHSKGIIHRDVKPANIKVRPDGTPVILDFGIAKHTAHRDGHMTQTGITMGTQSYMAPEQLDAKNVDARADQYALAMMTYELFSGTFPWEKGFSRAKITVAKMMGSLTPLNDRSSVQQNVADVVMRGLSLEREDRFTSCSAFVDALQVLCERSTRTKSKKKKKQRRTRKTSKSSGGLLLFIVGLGAVLGVLAVIALVVIGTISKKPVPSEKKGEPKPIVVEPSVVEPIEVESIVNKFNVEKIKAGKYKMGCTTEQRSRCQKKEKPAHTVVLSHDTVMMTTEVTQGLYESVMGKNPSRFSECGTDCPVEYVSWYDAVRFANALNQKLDLTSCYEIGSGDNPTVLWNDTDCLGWRLPTEAEWEYAARGGERLQYSGSKRVDEVGWHSNNSQQTTHVVGTKESNGYGLYDMSGNVLEWVWDTWDPKAYKKGAVTDPVINTSNSRRVVRGGGFDQDITRLRTSARLHREPSSRSANRGFRLIRRLPHSSR